MTYHTAIYKGERMNILIRNIFLIYFALSSVFFVTFYTKKTFANDDNISNLENKAQLIISSQISAFLNYDTKEAYSFASPVIKSMFKNADIFGSMVKSSYPMIWAPKEFKFLEFTFYNESLIQRVLFIDKNEKIFMFDYEIKNYGEDNWLINGVYQVKKSQSGV